MWVRRRSERSLEGSTGACLSATHGGRSERANWRFVSFDKLRSPHPQASSLRLICSTESRLYLGRLSSRLLLPNSARTYT